MNDQYHFEWKKAADSLISKFWTVKLLYSYMRHLYQMIDCNNWLTTSYTNKQLLFNLLQYYNSICPNLSCLDIFMIRWWWTNSQWCNLTLTKRFWGTKVCLQDRKIFKICLFGCPTGRATSWNANFENYSRYFFDKIVSSLINIIQHEKYFFSFKAHLTVCTFLWKSHQIMLESHVSSSG